MTSISSSASVPTTRKGSNDVSADNDLNTPNLAICTQFRNDTKLRDGKGENNHLMSFSSLLSQVARSPEVLWLSISALNSQSAAKPFFN